MGAINNAFNQAAGAVAGSALAIKHAKEIDASRMDAAEHSALIARNQSREADAAVNGAKLEEEKLNTDWANAMIENIDKTNKYEKAKRRKNASAKTVNKKFTELQASERALDELNNKINSIQVMKDRAYEQRVFAAKATEREKDAQAKFFNKWGDR